MPPGYYALVLIVVLIIFSPAIWFGFAVDGCLPWLIRVIAYLIGVTIIILLLLASCG